MVTNQTIMAFPVAIMGSISYNEWTETNKNHKMWSKTFLFWTKGQENNRNVKPAPRQATIHRYKHSITSLQTSARTAGLLLLDTIHSQWHFRVCCSSPPSTRRTTREKAIIQIKSTTMLELGDHRYCKNAQTKLSVILASPFLGFFSASSDHCAFG